MNPEIKDLRSIERYVVVEPLLGSFGAAAISVLDIAEQGAQIEHPQPLRLGARGRFWFKRRDVAVSMHAIVIWSRLSQTPNDEGKLLYRSGLRVDEQGESFGDAIQALADHGVIRRDTESLERKRRKLLERQQEKNAKPSVKLIKTDDTSADQALLVQQARERLLADPEEARKWYNRARYAIVENSAPIAAEIRGREDVLAVWEYLERSVPLSTIVRLFDRKS
jgi:PilZ domain-containing protein